MIPSRSGARTAPVPGGGDVIGVARVAVRRRRAAIPAVQDSARETGLDMTTVFGGRDTNVYLVETTGTGVAMIDHDGDGLVDG